MRPTDQAGANQTAFGMMMAQVKRFGWTVRRFQEELEQHGLFYSRDGINNWGKRGRAFPNNPALIEAIVAILASDPKRRWSAATCIEFALAAGQPFEFLERLNGQPSIPADEYREAVKQHLAGRFGLGAASAAGAGAELLLSMPIDYVPSPAALPPGSCGALFPRSPFFTGRDQDLMHLAYQVRETRAARIVVTGVSGQGKTQFANEFARCYGQFFAGGVLIATADTPERLTADMLACGGERGLALHPGFSGLPEAEQLQLLRQALAAPVPRLLIIDNASSRDAYLLDELLPAGDSCVVLVTSQHQDWGPQWRIIDLPPLSPAESVRVFRRICPHLAAADEPMLLQIARRFDCLPFAVALASAFLRKQRHGPLGLPGNFYETLCSRETMDHEAMLQPASEIAPTKARSSVSAALAVMLAALEEGDQIDQHARAILVCAAACAPGAPLPVGWLLAGTLGQGCEQAPPRPLLAALQRLRDLGLLTAGPDQTVLLHRLLRSYVRTQNDMRAPLARLARTACGEMARYETSITQLHPIAQHVREVARQALDHGLADAVELCMGIGWYASLNGQHEEAIRWQEEARASALASHGRYHALTGEVYCRLGLAHIGLNHYERGAHELRTMVEIFEQIYDEEHPERAQGYQNYGNALILRGLHAEGEEMIRRSLAIRRRRWRERPGDGAIQRDIARNLRTLGQLSWYVGRYRRAYWYTLLAWRIFAREPEQAPIALAQTCHNLGFVLFLAGRYAEARELLGRALALRQGLYQSRRDAAGRIWHQDIAETLAVLGWARLEEGRLEEAEPLLREAASINEVVLGAASYETVLALEPLAELALERRQLAEARALIDRIDDALREIFGTATTLAQARSHGQRARLALLAGDPGAARELAEEARAICARVCPGHAHPIAGWAARTLSEAARAAGDAAGAERWRAEALAILGRAIPGHPRYLRLRDEAGASWQNQALVV